MASFLDDFDTAHQWCLLLGWLFNNWDEFERQVVTYWDASEFFNERFIRCTHLAQYIELADNGFALHLYIKNPLTWTAVSEFGEVQSHCICSWLLPLTNYWYDALGDTTGPECI